MFLATLLPLPLVPGPKVLAHILDDLWLWIRLLCCCKYDIDILRLCIQTTLCINEMKCSSQLLKKKVDPCITHKIKYRKGI
jgi:hypothetical protein